MGGKLGILLGIFFAVSLVSAGCASEAYAKSCANCQFDASGKMDQSCYQGYQASGTGCLATTYPVANAKYVAGNCPGIDSCIEDLNACKAQYASGDDRADCAEGSVGVCFAAADSCVKSAAMKCGEIESQCPGSSAALVLPLLGTAAIALYGRLRAG